MTVESAKPIRTRGGRVVTAVGDVSLVTLERIDRISEHFDAEPRLASVSLVASEGHDHVFLRATAPAGAVSVIAVDLADVAGMPPNSQSTPSDVLAWARSASDHGLWHDWLLIQQPDVVRAPTFITASNVDITELDDPAGSHYATLIDSTPSSAGLTVTIDATWLGPHETGAQVLTTAAVEALVRQPGIAGVTLTGISDLPGYAAHLADLPLVAIAADTPARADIVWYPNQIDQRSNIGAARSLGHRVVTTYLDLIAYDIPRYHAGEGAWRDYRSLQRSIALSVDGITTISADVARRLVQEVPHLDRERVRPIPLGLDHIARQTPAIGSDISALAQSLGDRPFLLVLGNDFVHKNRDFAIRVWERLLDSGVSCDVVLAGLHVRSSSSKDSERELLALHTNLRGRVHTVGHISGASRSWLLARASVVVYPSSAEGFGFVPYEAAALGTPTTFTGFGPLAEISGLTDVPRRWSIDDYADDVRTLLTDEGAARQRVTDLRAAEAHHTWERFASELTRFFDTIRSMPPVLSTPQGSVRAPVSPTMGFAHASARQLRGIARRLSRRGR